MSQWIGCTNQKLYQCRLLQDQMIGAVGQPALRQALEESAVYQLRDAWVAYCNELAEAALNHQPVTSFSELLESSSVVTGEMREVQHLLDDSFSWLAMMLAEAKRIQQPIARPKADKKGHQHHHDSEQMAQRIDLIAVVDVQPVTDVNAWWLQFNKLIDSQRANRLES